MAKNSNTTVSGIFRSRDDISEIINSLEEKGISEQDISILMSEETQKNQFGIDTDTKAPEGAVKGLTAGGLLGAVIGGLTLVGAVIIPGPGLVVAGPIIGILAGMAAGGLAGTLVGALIGMGIPEYEAKFYEQSINERGNILLVAHINKDLKPDVKKLFNQYGAYHITSR